MCTRAQALAILNKTYDAYSKVLRIQDAYLYGSYARGDHNEASDVDILIIANMDATEIEKLSSAMAAIDSDLSLKHNVTISATVKPLAQFLRYKNVLPYYKNVVKEGIKYARS